MIKSKTMRSNLLLVITAFIWGTAFIAQKAGVDLLDPCTYNGIRSYLGFAALVPVILVMDAKSKKNNTYKPDDKKLLICGGIVCGIIMFIASTLQTAALVDADAGKAGFMTALYIIIVPLLGVFIGKKIKSIIWISVAIATAGLYFLCVKKGTSFSFNKSELLLLACAVMFSFHILAIDYFSPKVNGVKLSTLQFFVVGCISLVYILIVDKPSVSDIIRCGIPLAYAGVMSSGVAYTLQIVAQKDTDPAVASLIMSLESFFALLAGIAFGEKPGVRELIGCMFMMTAIVLVQLPEKSIKQGDKSNA